MYQVPSTRYQDPLGGESRFHSESLLQHAALGVHHSTLSRYQVSSSKYQEIRHEVPSTRRGGQARYQDLLGGESRFQSESLLQHDALGVHHSKLA